jgi:RNA polymerase sigma factor (sigma-70 family)
LSDHVAHVHAWRDEVRRLASTCTRLAWKAARDAARYYGIPADELGDLASEAFLGIVRAAQKYDPAHGTRFITYATPWARQFCQRYWLVRRRKGFTAVGDRVPSFAPAGDDGTPAAEFLGGRDSRDPVSPSDLARLLDDLGERERSFVRLRFFDGMKLREIAERFGVTKERVRQVLVAALRRLRASRAARELAGECGILGEVCA